MKELPLFMRRPQARQADPETSQFGAHHAVMAGKQRKQKAAVLRAVELHPGHTSKELAALMAVDRYCPSRRLPDLLDEGRVRQGHKRACRITGRMSHTWWPAARAKDYYDREAKERQKLSKSRGEKGVVPAPYLKGQSREKAGEAVGVGGSSVQRTPAGPPAPKVVPTTPTPGAGRVLSPRERQELRRQLAEHNHTFAKEFTEASASVSASASPGGGGAK